MTEAELKPHTRDIVIDEVFPHAPEAIWKMLTTVELIERWLMRPNGFEAKVGNVFTYQTKPAGAWDGTIRCQVLDVLPDRRLSYAWRGGDEGNVGYGSRLDTIVTWTLLPDGNGTRVRLVHSGFVVPKNDTAFTNMNEGWTKVVGQLDAAVGENE